MKAANAKPADGVSLVDRLARIEQLETELLRKATTLFKLHDSIYQADFFVMGALKRFCAQSKGFRELISAHNFQCAAAILRCQIDTAMRVNALRLAADRDAMCGALLAGERFNALKDSAGKRMTDAYLREKLTEHYPWIDEVYRQTSDFVHLSGRHFYTSVVGMDDETRTVRFAISGTDPPRPEEDYFEITKAFFEVSKITGLFILGYFHARAENHVTMGPLEVGRDQK